MMRHITKRLFLGVCLSGAMIATLTSLAAEPQRGDRGRAAADTQAKRQANDLGDMIPLGFLPPPSHTMTVVPSRKLGAEARALHRPVAEALKIWNMVPQRRLQHFQWVDAPQYRLLGWHCYIEAIEPIPGGQSVTLRVSPLIAIAAGNEVGVRDYMIEKYHIVDGVPVLVEVIDPPGTGRPSYYTF